MKFLKIFASSKSNEQFLPGEKVNLVHFGQIPKTDGVVVAQRNRDVLVEWRLGGSSFERTQDLCKIEAA